MGYRGRPTSKDRERASLRWRSNLLSENAEPIKKNLELRKDTQQSGTKAMALPSGVNQLATINPSNLTVKEAGQKGCVLFKMWCRFKGQATVLDSYTCGVGRILNPCGSKGWGLLSVQHSRTSQLFSASHHFSTSHNIYGPMVRFPVSAHKFSMMIEEVLEAQKRYPGIST
jgi:hypothetical protein